MCWMLFFLLETEIDFFIYPVVKEFNKPERYIGLVLQIWLQTGPISGKNQAPKAKANFIEFCCLMLDAVLRLMVGCS